MSTKVDSLNSYELRSSPVFFVTLRPPRPSRKGTQPGPKSTFSPLHDPQCKQSGVTAQRGIFVLAHEEGKECFETLLVPAEGIYDGAIK